MISEIIVLNVINSPVWFRLKEKTGERREKMGREKTRREERENGKRENGKRGERKWEERR